MDLDARMGTHILRPQREQMYQDLQRHEAAANDWRAVGSLTLDPYLHRCSGGKSGILSPIAPGALHSGALRPAGLRRRAHELHCVPVSSAQARACRHAVPPRRRSGARHRRRAAALAAARHRHVGRAAGGGGATPPRDTLLRRRPPKTNPRSTSTRDTVFSPGPHDSRHGSPQRPGRRVRPIYRRLSSLVVCVASLKRPGLAPELYTVVRCENTHATSAGCQTGCHECHSLLRVGPQRHRPTKRSLLFVACASERDLARSPLEGRARRAGKEVRPSLDLGLFAPLVVLRREALDAGGRRPRA